MSAPFPSIVLGSRSPRRLELLRLLVPAECIRVVPPASSHEMGFDDLADRASIERRLTEIARSKGDDVLSQLDRRAADRDTPVAAVVVADTVIVVDREEGRPGVLGQPPEDDSWRDVVSGWFRDHYFGRTHSAITAFRVATPAGRAAHAVVESRVTFHPADEQSAGLLDWYLGTGEPRGKAGGYALQGAGGVFVAGVEGSISNVVGLPLRELHAAFREVGVDVAAIRA